MWLDVCEKFLGLCPMLDVKEHIVQNVEDVKPPPPRRRLLSSSGAALGIAGLEAGEGSQVPSQGSRPGGRPDQMLQQPLLALL